jgi:hypothetical protein
MLNMLAAFIYCCQISSLDHRGPFEYKHIGPVFPFKEI